MEELFELVWIHPSPLVTLAQLQAESSLGDDHLFCKSFKIWFIFTILILLDSSTMRETNGRRKYELTVVPCMIYLDKQIGQNATPKVL